MRAPAPAFDEYVFVDWSAQAGPKTGRDSIWIGHGRRERPGVALCNPSTRHGAMRHLEAVLTAAVALRRRVLVGFDFAFGYPAGLAASLGLGPVSAPPWRRMWDELDRLTEDGPDNANNRFAVASALNRRLGAAPGPFWGCPPGRTFDGLTATRGPAPHVTADGTCLEEFRHTDRALWARGLAVHPVWKLCYPGSVGSQTVLGIPRLAALRRHDLLGPLTRVWPFETGFTPDPAPGSRPFVLVCEVWPGVVDKDPGGHPVRDAAQVAALAVWARQGGEDGTLARLLARPALRDTQLQACLEEEGWILGG